MRNKATLSQSCEAAVSARREAGGAVLSEPSCATRPPQPGARPLQGQRNHTCGAAYTRIAPVFLRQIQRRRRSDGDQRPGPAPSEEQEVRGQRRFPASAASHLRQEDRCVASARRAQLPPPSLHSCLQEARSSSAAFPVHTVLGALQRKAGEEAQDFGSTAGNPLHTHRKEKRKGDERSERGAKRLRCGLPDTDQGPLSAPPAQDSTVLPVEEPLRQQGGSCVNQREPEDTQPAGQPPTPCDVLHRGSSLEDVLWTDKYSPQHSGEVIGNSVSVHKLHSWLKKWKLRADRDERRKMAERKDEDNSSASWDCGDFQGEAGAQDDREDPLCNTLLITGPPGVGKTASVYACAQELGFKVFEVNCSSQRSGRHVLSQLTEATQSHLVETSGKDPLRPAYLNNYNTSSCAPKPETLPGKTLPPKNVISTTKKRTAQKFGRSHRKGKANPATVTLANYFKMKAKADHLHFGGLSPSEKPDSKKSGSPSPGCDQTGPRSRTTATSLILFEEVDVIFSDDVGFLAAIKTFMTTTKRPVILTTNDPLFRERFNCSLEEIIFKTPSVATVCSYLQLLCVAENVRLQLDDVRSLLQLTCGDVRRSLLQLQLWVHSGGGRASQGGGFPKQSTHVRYSNDAEVRDNLDSSLPPCDTGCTASMLGLHLVTQSKLLNLLKSQHWTETDANELLRLLAESWRGGVPLLYTNLELLLPISTKGTSVHHLDKVSCSGLQGELAPPDPDPHLQQLNPSVSPTASATSSKPVRTISRLRRRKYIATVFDTTSSSTLTNRPQRPSLSLQGARSRPPSSSDKTEQLSAKVTTDCLDALSDFFDLMSYLDVTLPAAAQLVSGSCRPEAFVWTGAEMKDGLLDEMSEEGGRSCSQERLLDIQAAAEGLGFHRCWWRVSEAWTQARKYTQEVEDKKWERLVERLTLPTTSKRQSLRFSSQPLCAPGVSQRRYELSRKVLSSKSLSLLGNRQAVSVDYMPVLRSICRFHVAQQQKEESTRCLNYLSSAHLGLSKSTFQLLAEDFS
ncbi:ATPase family AAA domain-containing protein 5b [Trachinotus anak]|uniref:ATPase family AAA domain-containing protein 5b n=1 Tax=Trachinotus anak TaxID=443729 RepID=UPI0039F1D567